MTWTRACVLAVMLACCTTPNKAKHCMDGTCTTPAFPFCDVSGFASGEAGTCVAVSCEAGTFGECRGGFEVRCNATGDNYDVVQCERGCDATADGCRLCSPNETACTNGKVATCDANGAVVSAVNCPLGCFEDQPRCREIDPSNGLAAYADMVMNPPDLDLKDVFIDPQAGTIEERPTGPSINVPNFLVPAAPGGAPIRVFVARSVRIAKALVAANQAVNFHGPAFALVALGDIEVVGNVQIANNVGYVELPGCTGGHGRLRSNCNYSSAGGGGGGFASAGAKGGDVPNNSELGGFAGAASGTANLVPLRGGCPGGGLTDELGNPPTDYLSPGGGAVQLTSRTRISVTGTIDARGADGFTDYLQPAGFEADGGGAGGGILLEAPTVELGPSAKVLATGGSGATACSMMTANCAAGGAGATSTAPAMPGNDIDCPANFATTVGGGGGGGLGRLRVNTRDGSYTKSNTTVEDASTSSGTVQTR